MSNVTIAKAIVSLIVGAGTSQIVKDIVKNNTDPENIYQKVTIFLGAIAIGGVVAQQAQKYSDEKIDGIIRIWQQVIEKTEETTETA